MTSLNISRAVTAVVDQVARNGGATESIVAGVETPITGYAVSIPGRECVNHLLLDGDQRTQAITDRVYDYAVANQAWLSQPGYYLGAWLDGDRLVLDVTQVTPELGQAVTAGVAREQDAIYNLADGAELWLKRKALPWVTDEQGKVWELLDNVAWDHTNSGELFEVVEADAVRVPIYAADAVSSDGFSPFEVVGNVRAHLARTDAQKRFDALSDDTKRALARQVFEILEYDEDDQPGGTWGGDEIAAIGELYTNHGITFSQP